jgi:carbon storage regulator
MLVLSRRENEGIVIDGCIKVTVLEIRGSQIRLGIEAPHDVPVWREELVLGSPNTTELARSVSPNRDIGHDGACMVRISHDCAEAISSCNP